MEKAKKNAPKKEKKIGGGSCPPGKCFFWGGGKCPNLGVVNVRNLGVVNVLLANDSQSNVCWTRDNPHKMQNALRESSNDSGW